MLARDKVLHIGLGFLWLSVSLVGFLIYHFYGLGPAAAYSTTSYAVLYEINQKIRKEGQPDFWDAAATSLPGWLAWLILANFT